MIELQVMEGEALDVVETKRRRRVAVTLADVRDRLTEIDGKDTKEAKLRISAINTVARALNCAPDDLPVDPARLRPMLAGISPAMAGLTRGSWSSVRSRILRALQRTDVQVMSGRRTKPLSDQWAPLYRALFSNGKQAALGRFIGYLSDHSISPADVSDGYIKRFAAELNASSLRGLPTVIVRAAIHSWNNAVKEVPGWPQGLLTVPASGREGYVFPAASFSASFQKSLSDYLAFLANPPEDDDAPPRGLRPTTLSRREFQFGQMASALVHRGVAIEAITSITTLASQENVDTICEFFIERAGRPDCVQLNGFLRVLRPLALHNLGDKGLAEWINRRMKRLAGGQRRFGMTEKNRRRLAVFRDPRHVRDLLFLPYKLLKRAEAGSLRPTEAAKLVRAAVAIELEIMCPIRLQNLSELNVDTDFVRSHAGKKATVHLFIPGHRTKNGEEIELELPRPSMDLIDLYLAKYRTHLIDPPFRGSGPRFLFPRPNGTAKTGHVLADNICRIMQRELGIKFNMHLFRHLGCFLYLKNHPGQIDVMRRVLGHRDGETTMRFYASVEQSEAFRMFDTHVLQIRDEALRPSRKKTPAGKGARK
jgi:integrase